MEIIVGSYDSAVVGYRLKTKPKPKDPGTGFAASGVEVSQADSQQSEALFFEPRFSDVSQRGCIRSLAVSEKGFLVSGSTDETIHILDLERGTDVGSLASHEGDITCLKFAGKDYLYSAGTDGTIRMWRARIWELQRTFKGHRGAVLSFDIHPSKKLALSVGADDKLIVWDLVAGKYSFIRNMRKVYDLVRFSPSGTFYLLKRDKKVEVFNLSATDSVTDYTFTHAVGDIRFINDDLLLCATTSGKILFFSIGEKSVMFEFQAHESRIRGTEFVSLGSSDVLAVVTASSDQTIKAWTVDLKQKNCRLLASINTGCRITALAMQSTSDGLDALLKKADQSMEEECLFVEMDDVPVSDDREKKKSNNLKRPRLKSTPASSVVKKKFVKTKQPATKRVKLSGR